MKSCPCNKRCELHGWLDDDQYCKVLGGGGQRNSDWFSRLIFGECKMRCERCHGSMYVNGQPCQYCLGGQTSCCEGPVCEPYLPPHDLPMPDYEYQQPDLFDDLKQRQSGK